MLNMALLISWIEKATFSHHLKIDFRLKKNFLAEQRNIKVLYIGSYDQVKKKIHRPE
jgi:hypothetical protein